MKKIIFIVFIFVFSCTNVFAEELYFVNYYGGTLNREEYDRLHKYFDYDTLYTFSNNMLDYYKNSEDIIGVEK